MPTFVRHGVKLPRDKKGDKKGYYPERVFTQAPVSNTANHATRVQGSVKVRCEGYAANGQSRMALSKAARHCAALKLDKPARPRASFVQSNPSPLLLWGSWHHKFNSRYERFVNNSDPRPAEARIAKAFRASMDKVKGRS